MNKSWEWLKARSDLMMVIGLVIAIAGLYIGSGSLFGLLLRKPVSLLLVSIETVLCFQGCGLFIYGLILSGRKKENGTTVAVIDPNLES